MQPNLLTIFFCSIALCFSAQVCAAPPQKPGDIQIEKKSFETKAGKVIKYELGTLFVPENRSDPKSRVIGIGFARFRATVKTPTAPAMFKLPGGPGGSILERMKASSSQREDIAQELDRFLPYFDVVYVDQRGYSAHGDILRATKQIPKRPTDRASTAEDRIAGYQTFARETVAKFAKTEIDLRGYTVKECAHDVADLRKALGYDKIMLNGTSFGSQWSFAVMRLHPEIVARALLSGVEPLNQGYDMPSYIFAAMQRMWRTIDEDEKFKPYLPPGGVAEAARVVIERLEREPIVIEGETQSKGEKKTTAVFGPWDFPWNDPAEILALYHGHTEPWERMAEEGRESSERSVKLIGPLIDTSLGVTPERRHRLWTDPAIRYITRGNFASYLATADIWPSPDVGDDFRTPILCEIPVVFAQGTWDISTPVENTFEIAPFFINSRVIIADRGGHGVLDSIARQLPKVGAEMDEFLRTGDMNGIPGRVMLAPSRRFTAPTFPVALGKPVQWGPPLGSPLDDTVVQMRVSEVPQKAGQVISVFTRFKLPKGKHLYSAAIKNPGIQTEFEFRGQGFELAGSIKEPDAHKVQSSALTTWELRGSPVFEQQLLITNVQEFLSRGPFLFVYAPICDAVSCNRYQEIFHFDSAKGNFVEASISYEDFESKKMAVQSKSNNR